jgi:predicted enzyme related to lactoylglutathione lyase
MTIRNLISWFELPAADLDRAQNFYETIFDIQMIPLDMPQLQMRLFPTDNPNNYGGAICSSSDFYQSSDQSGPLIYLNGDPDVQLILDKIEIAGGKIVIPKTQISPEYGYMAVFLDTEGNRVALYSSPLVSLMPQE